MRISSLTVPALLLTAVTLGTSQSASAQLFFKAPIFSGAQEAPPNGPVASGGFGSGSVIVLDLLNGDGIFDTLRINYAVQNLNSNITDSHIHLAPPGVNGPVRVRLFGVAAQGLATFPTGLNSYSLQIDINRNSPGQVATQIDETINTFVTFGDGPGPVPAYFNVHTVTSGPGEIRGNIFSAAPEPGTFALLAVGGMLPLAGVAIRRRK